VGVAQKVLSIKVIALCNAPGVATNVAPSPHRALRPVRQLDLFVHGLGAGTRLSTMVVS
jgi:hypothetical protein